MQRVPIKRVTVAYVNILHDFAQRVERRVSCARRCVQLSHELPDPVHLSGRLAGVRHSDTVDSEPSSLLQLIGITERLGFADG
jgi:hypothetical protein